MIDKTILYVTDLDGTLLNTKGQIPKDSSKLINELIHKGMNFTYATARSLESAYRVTDGLEHNIPVIVYNGAFIVNAGNREILQSCEFTREQKEKVQMLLSEYKLYPLVYGYRNEGTERRFLGMEKVSWYSDYENEGIKHYLNMRKGDKRMNPLSLQEDLYKGRVFYFTCIGEREDLQPVYERLKEEKEYRCTLQQEIYRPEYWLEIMPSQATKANGILKLKEMLGCKKVISFGDAINDLPMFKISDECYAVENAVEELKQAATGVIGSNEEEGVKRWLAEHVVKDYVKRNM